MKICRQNCWSQVLWIVGNVASAIAAEYEGDKLCRRTRSRYARTHRQQLVTAVHHNLCPLYFRRAYHMTYESFCRLHDKLSSGIQAAARFLRIFRQSVLEERKRAPLLS